MKLSVNPFSSRKAMLRLLALVATVVVTVGCNDTPLTSGNPTADAPILTSTDLETTGRPLQCTTNQRLSLNRDISFVIDNSASNAGYQKAAQGQRLPSFPLAIPSTDSQNHNRFDWYATMTDCDGSSFQPTGLWTKDERGANFQPLGTCSHSWRKSMVDAGVQYYRSAQGSVPAGQRKAISIAKFPYGSTIPTGGDEYQHRRWLDPVNSFSYLSAQATNFLGRPQGDSPATQAFGLVREMSNSAPTLNRGGAKPVVIIVTDGFATDNYQTLESLLARSASYRQNADVYVFMTMASESFPVHRSNFIRAMSERNNGANLEQYMQLNLGTSSTGFQNSFYQRMVGKNNFLPVTSSASFQSLLFHTLQRDNHIQCI